MFAKYDSEKLLEHKTTSRSGFYLEIFFLFSNIFGFESSQLQCLLILNSKPIHNRAILQKVPYVFRKPIN